MNTEHLNDSREKNSFVFNKWLETKKENRTYLLCS